MSAKTWDTMSAKTWNPISVKRLLRFLSFFRYLNFATLTRLIVCSGKRRLSGLSAEMAYNAMLALFPAILAILTAIGLFEYSRSTVEQLAWRLSEIAPQQVLTLIQNFTREISLSQNPQLFSISFIAALWTASGVISAAMAALDQIHQVPPDQVRPFWKAKLISLGLTVGTISLLIVASVIIFVSGWAIRFIANQSGDLLTYILLTIWKLLSWPLPFGLVAAAFAFLYRYGPSHRRPGTPIFPGAMLAALAWAILSGSFRYYVANFGHYNKVYGAVGAVIVLLLWLYLTALAMLLGSQLNVIVGEAMQRVKDKS